MTRIAAWAGVHRRHEEEPSREDRHSGGSSNPHNPFLQRLTKYLEGTAVKLRNLVKKEHAVVREAHLPWAWLSTTPDECGVRN